MPWLFQHMVFGIIGKGQEHNNDQTSREKYGECVKFEFLLCG
jgi:hypothetical protein